jgi:predicted heme/steroid binding protein
MERRARTSRGGARGALDPAALRLPTREVAGLARVAALLTIGALLAEAGLALTVALPAGAWASPGYASRTGMACDYCHVAPGGPLTEAGEAFKVNGYELPAVPDTTAVDGEGGGVPSPGTTVVPPGGGSDAPAPLLSLGRGLKGLLRWVHVLGVIAWFGGIFTVFFVQGREVAAGGIPRTYLRLAWPAIALVGASGLILLLDDVTGLDMLFGTRWGLMLLLKIVIFLVLVLIAAVATLLISPRLEQAATAEAPAGRSQEQYRAQGRITVSYRGRVYDVTGSRRWPEGRHVNRHDAWKDLSSALADAPHGPEVLGRFILVEDSHVGEAGGSSAKRLFSVMTTVVVMLMLAAVLVVAFW